MIGFTVAKPVLLPEFALLLAEPIKHNLGSEPVSKGGVRPSQLMILRNRSSSPRARETGAREAVSAARTVRRKGAGHVSSFGVLTDGLKVCGPPIDQVDETGEFWCHEGRVLHDVYVSKKVGDEGLQHLDLSLVESSDPRPVVVIVVEHHVTMRPYHG